MAAASSSSLVDFVVDRASILERIDERVASLDVDNRTFERLYEEYTYLRQASRMDLALAKAVDLIACLEANAKATGGEPEQDLKAVAVFNLASALHQLGHFSIAKPFYTEAIMGLDNAPRNPFLCCLPDIRPSQVQYMKLRMEEANRGVIPEALTYLDGDGIEQQWTEYEISIARKKSDTIEHIMHAEATARKKPKPAAVGPGGMKLSLNVNAANSNRGKASPITSTPRKELW